MSTPICTHDMADKDTACADGLCPICLEEELARLRARLDAEPTEAMVKAGADEARAWLKDQSDADMFADICPRIYKAMRAAGLDK